jgi:hypothetical protein
MGIEKTRLDNVVEARHLFQAQILADNVVEAETLRARHKYLDSPCKRTTNTITTQHIVRTEFNKQNEQQTKRTTNTIYIYIYYICTHFGPDATAAILARMRPQPVACCICMMQIAPWGEKASCEG